MSDRLDGKQYVESRTTYGMSQPQPDTFASVKKRWRERDSGLGDCTVAERDCADELESGLEQQVRELRDECWRIARTERGPLRSAFKQMGDQLTALLGEEPK